MTEISESNFSDVIFLLKQHKYEEALPILNDLVEKNPSHQEYFLYHLLVLRILVLRWNLSRKATGPLNYSREVVERITSRLASLERIPKHSRAIRSLGDIYQSAQTSLAQLRTKYVSAVGTCCALVITLLGFYMNTVSSVKSLAPSTKLTAVYGAQLVAPASEVTAHYPSTTEVTGPERQGTPLPGKADEQKFLRAVSNAGEVLLLKVPTKGVAVNGHSYDEPSHAATAPVSEPNAVAKRPELTVVRKIESPSVVATNKIASNKTARKYLGEYQSRQAIRIRISPSFAAKTVQEIDRGILLNVLEFIGSWAKVELRGAGITGFVRREFLILTTNDESNKTDRLAEVEEPTDPTTLAFQIIS